MKYTCEAMRRMSQCDHNQDPYFHPYRHRKTSTTSTYSDCSSASGNSPSGSQITSPAPYYPENPMNHGNLYDRLKQYISEVPKDPVVCQILLQSLAHVIELEQQLAVLEEKTRHLQNMRQKNVSDTCRHVSNEKVPEDLANVDVTEFKHLVLSSPLIYESISY